MLSSMLFAVLTIWEGEENKGNETMSLQNRSLAQKQPQASLAWHSQKENTKARRIKKNGGDTSFSFKINYQPNKT